MIMCNFEMLVEVEQIDVYMQMFSGVLS